MKNEKTKLRGLISNLVGALKRLHGQPTRRDLRKPWQPPHVDAENAAQMFGQADAAEEFRR